MSEGKEDSEGTKEEEGGDGGGAGEQGREAESRGGVWVEVEVEVGAGPWQPHTPPTKSETTQSERLFLSPTSPPPPHLAAACWPLPLPRPSLPHPLTQGFVSELLIPPPPVTLLI